MNAKRPAYMTDPHEFRQRLVIECDGQPKRLAAVMDPWQRDDFWALDSGWQLAAGHAPTHGPVRLRAYLERGRGSSKTTDLAAAACFALYGAERQITGVVAAADQDQARIDLAAISKLCRLNPALAVLDVQRNIVRNKLTGSELTVLSSDAATSFGLLVDFIICDELSNWSAGNGEELWHSLFSAAAKKANCLLCIISNAGLGMGSSWQWKVREAAREDAAWYFSRLDGPQASWITPERLEEQRRFLPPGPYNRLWLNQWCSAEGDLLSPESIEAAIDDTLAPLEFSEPGWFYVGGLDLATTRDHSALAIVAVNPATRQMRLASLESWAPELNRETDQLEQIYLAVLAAAWAFPGILIGADPWQASMLIQRARREGVNIDRFDFTPKNLSAMASTIVQVFNDRLFTMYRNARLLEDLSRLRLVEKSFGLKIEAPRTRDGHCDRAMALAISLVLATEYCGTYQEPIPDDGLAELFSDENLRPRQHYH